MSLTAFQRYRRMKPVEEMKPENIVKETPTLENFTTEPLVPEEIPEEIPAEEPLVPEELPEETEEINTENKEKTKTANRRKGNK